MKLRKHYEPTVLAGWNVIVEAAADKIERSLRAAGVERTRHQIVQMARDLPVIEHARKRIPVTHVSVLDTGCERAQQLSADLVQGGMADGWIKVDGSTLTMRCGTDADGKRDDLTYEIVRSPGYYCGSSGERIPLSEPAWSQAQRQTEATLAPREAKAWLVARGRAPDDYDVVRVYDLVLDAAQQARHGLKLGA